MRALILSGLLALSTLAHAEIIEIYQTSEQKTISKAEFISTTPKTGYFILGEFHNNLPIQKAQAEIIQLKVEYEKRANEFGVFWEFLNYTSQNTTNIMWNDFYTHQISVEDFLTATAGKQNLIYAPIFETSKSLNGTVEGINLPRPLKQKVIKEGINSIDPKYIPINHYVGGAEYKERFIQAMGGHAPQDIIEKYFMVQCLTDSIMADQIAMKTRHPLNFVIAGSFHTDFYDATVIRLNKLVNNDIITLKFININDHTAQELNEFKSNLGKYGSYADYIVITK